MITLAELNCYPVKSCRGFDAARMALDARGLNYDRLWMVVGPSGDFLSQRRHARMALVRTAIDDASELVLSAPGRPDLRIPLEVARAELRTVQCWGYDCLALDEGPESAEWLSDFLATPARLVRMVDDFERIVDARFAPDKAVTAFSDGFPLLLVSEASLEELNRRLDEPLPMNRFRPNLVVKGCEPFAEDGWKRLRIAGIELEVCKPCSRCVVTTIDQATGERGPEPLRTLAAFRRKGNKVLFGQNLVHRGQGPLAVGDGVEVLEIRAAAAEGALP
jgi:uncharacterized protein YcbX